MDQLPVEWANYLSMAGFAFLGLLVWLVPKHLVYSEAKDNARWRDYRIWASALIAIQITLYGLF